MTITVPKSRTRFRKAKERAFFYVVCGFSLLTAVPLLLIIWEVVRKGYRQISLSFFTENAPSTLDAMLAKTAGESIPGGIANGILGTLSMTLIAALIAIPSGILAGVYLSEKRKTAFAGIVRFLTELLQGTPSIVIGIIAYAWIVVPLGSYSMLAGSVALAGIMLPLIVRSTEETLNMLPSPLKEAGLALGRDAYSGAVGFRRDVHRHPAGRIAGDGRNRPADADRAGLRNAELRPAAPHFGRSAADLGVLQRSEPRRPDLGLLAAAADPDAVAEYHCQTNRCKMENLKLQINDLSVAYTPEKLAVKHVTTGILERTITAIMGPSGCGKSTLLRAINRMHELYPDIRVTGEILLDERNIFKMNPMEVRRMAGMVFQRPNPFPTMSIYDNVLAGYKLNGIRLSKAQKDEIVETSLTSVGLWSEVRDSLFRKGGFLSGGQQQRLCIARAIALKPEVLLMDEPTSALDPIATHRVEELMLELKKEFTIVIVTHNMAQAARISDYSLFMYLGELVESGRTQTLFTTPKDKRTEEYLSGQFG